MLGEEEANDGRPLDAAVTPEVMAAAERNLRRHLWFFAATRDNAPRKLVGPRGPNSADGLIQLDPEPDEDAHTGRS
jgi:hypothetical protein